MGGYGSGRTGGQPTISLFLGDSAGLQATMKRATVQPEHSVTCSATRVVAGQRQPDGRSLRARKMAWLTPSGKQRCHHRGIF